jgi:hypothetical protein
MTAFSVGVMTGSLYESPSRYEIWLWRACAAYALLWAFALISFFALFKILRHYREDAEQDTEMEQR